MKPYISIRIVNIDHYLTEPGPYDSRYCPFSDRPLTKVPVLRIFGSTPGGQKTCLHVHQIYPYLYIPYPLSPGQSQTQLQHDIYQFGASLNKAICLSYDARQQQQQQHLAAMVLVKGVPFYGYHVGHTTYLKIYYLYPAERQRIAEILQQRIVMNNTFYQPYESHLSFELQFLMDYNLFGMDWIHLLTNHRHRGPQQGAIQLGTRFRQPMMDETKSLYRTQSTTSDNSNDSPSTDTVYTSATVPAYLQWDDMDRTSYCELEADTTPMMILNRLEVKERDIHADLDDEMADGGLAANEDEKLVTSLAGIWKDERRRRRRKSVSSLVKNDTAKPKAGEGKRPVWSTEQRLRAILKTMVTTNQRYSSSSTDDFPTIMTTFQAVQALYPKEYNAFIDAEQHTPTQARPANYYNSVMATPSRFAALTDTAVPTVDEGIMHLLRESQSFHEHDVDSDEDEVGSTTTHSSGDGEDNDNDNDTLRFGNEPVETIDPDLLEWIEQSEQKAKRATASTPKVDIEYSEEDFIIRPRKLNFTSSAAPAGSSSAPGNPTSAPENSSAPESRSRSTIGHALDVSELPPSIRRFPRKRKRIPQNDGAGDDTDDDAHVDKTAKRPADTPLASFGERQVSFSSFSSSSSSNDDYFIRDINGVWSPHKDSGPLESSQPSSPPKTTLRDDNRSSNSVGYYIFSRPPPVIPHGTLDMVYQEPYYSKPEDVPTIPKVFAGKEFKLASNTLDYLRPFDPAPLGGRCPVEDTNQPRAPSTVHVWTPATLPPTKAQVAAWMKGTPSVDLHKKPQVAQHTQILCSTAKNTYDFKYSPTKPKSKVTRIRDYLDLFSLEIHVNTVDALAPDPAKNEVQVIFWCLKTEDETIPKNGGFDDSYHLGILALGDYDITKLGITGIDITQVQQEQDLIWALVDKVRHYDPDLLVGYELHNSSWGYLIERALVYNINLVDELSRVYCASQRLLTDPWGYRKASVFRVVGRHMLNVWRMMRSEVTATSYRFENMVYNILYYRVPHYSHKTLTSWYQHGPAVLKNRLFKYYLTRVQLNLELLDASEVINKVSESARVFGIDFYSVITRGSQFKVESIMFRIAKPENFVMISPSRKQVGQQRAIECLPLVMEPISQFYSSPLLVLDFQSLYPSIMIAYNYCYSTCVGKIGTQEQTKNKLGVSELHLPDGLLGTVQDHLNVSPNGIAFVKPSIRKGLLGKMLSELLETRVMVKASMKDYKDDTGLLRLLNARQLTLKYVSNVTYGYTSAAFSGRMPCVEIADSIVQTGRETLENTIKLINEHTTWGAKVVYGDTDSVFVSLPGKSRSEAFDIGNDIAATVTRMNPEPMKLQFEKVYHPCLLIAKKRYVGNKYEHIAESKPVFEAKGIETVRRDGTAATQKIMEYCLKILFRSQDMSEVKEYLYDQWTKILSNRVSVQDFIIAKEVRMGTYRNLPHGAQVALAGMAKDPRAEPQYGERVPYVVVNQGLNARLKDRVAKPEVLIHDRSLRLDADYYIRKQIIAPLERVFKLVGVDVKAWYDEMPRSQKAMALSLAQPKEWNEKSTNRIDQYYASSHCVICTRLAHQVICDSCLANRSTSLFTLISRQRQTQKKLEAALLICQHCTGTTVADFGATESKDNLILGNTGYTDIPCDSLDCPVMYERIKAGHDVIASSHYDPLIKRLGQESDQD